MLDQLDALGRKVGAAGQRVRESELGRDAAQRRAQELHDERIRALAVNDTEAAARLQGEKLEAEQHAAEAADGAAGAQLARDQANSARQQFAIEHIDELLAEHRVTAEAAAEGITAALDELQAAHARWREAESTTQHLLRLSGRAQERTPLFPGDLSDLLRGLARSPAAVPVPLPISGRQFAAA